MLSILKNYKVLLDTWDEAVDEVKDVETKSRIRGESSQMSTFDFLFGSMLSEMVLRHTVEHYKKRHVRQLKDSKLQGWLLTLC